MPDNPQPAAPAPFPDWRPMHTVHHLVTIGDTSAVGPVYYSKLIDWQARCREEAGLLHIPEYDQGLSGHSAMVTRTCSCEYLKELWFGDHVTISVAVPWVRLHLMKALYAYHRLTDGAEELVATGEQLWASVRRNGNSFEPGPWPGFFIKTLADLGTDTTRAQHDNNT
jgi:acyl-CoA thioesterase FadM